MGLNLSGRTIARHSILNLLGLSLPLFVGLLTIPHIIKGLGMERFGFLTIAWTVLGYFNLFDLGLSRALTNALSERIGADSHSDRPDLIWTTLISMFGFAAAGALLLFALAETLVSEVLTVSTEMVYEFSWSLKIIALAIPATVVSTGLKGLLEAHQRFLHVNTIQIFLGTSSFLLPLIALTFSASLIYTVVAIGIARFTALIMYIFASLKTEPAFRILRPFNIQQLRRQLSYGGWVAVSSIVGPVMVYFDRFIIASMVSVSVVAYYTTPYEIVSKVTLISFAISSALFPALSAAFATDRSQAVSIFDRGLRYVLLSSFPVVFMLFSIAKTGLTLWLDADFASKSITVVNWLLAGIFLNCFAFIPFAFIQALKRPDITAKIHIIELPFYLIGLIALIKCFGITGAAIAWAFRAGIDGALLLLMSYRLVPETKNTIKRNGVIACLCLVLSAITSTLTESPYLLGYIAFVVLLSSIAAWSLMLNENERAFIKGR